MSSTPDALSLTAPAKINVFLRVLGKRPDGYHDVETLMSPVSVADRLELQPLPAKKIKFTCSDATLPLDETNLVMKALRAFEQRTGVQQGWRIHLEKEIPSGAGLGGGSSDAAAMLRGLNQWQGFPLSEDDLRALACGLGSDVPFFLHGRPCLGTGRGEVVSPAKFPADLPLVLIKPPFGIPTPWAYQHWAGSQELPGVLYAPQLCPWGAMVNDLERPVFQKYTLLPALKRWLLDQAETFAALMSGSGSTVYAVARDPIAANDLAEKAQAWCGETTWVRVATTLGIR